MMITDDERREVARRLREPFDVIGQGRYVSLNGTLFGMQLLAGDEGTLRAGIACLADLIEPDYDRIQSEPCTMEGAPCPGEALPEIDTCDRDALLRLARYMDKDVAETEAHFSSVISTKSVSDYARRIRKALGVES